MKWLNKSGESYNHYDFELLDEQGNIIQVIECKGTPRDKPTFYLTAQEWHFFLENKKLYQLFRVFNVEGEMYTVSVKNLLKSILKGKVVPYLSKPEILKDGRVFLTLNTQH